MIHRETKQNRLGDQRRATNGSEDLSGLNWPSVVRHVLPFFVFPLDWLESWQKIAPVQQKQVNQWTPFKVQFVHVHELIHATCYMFMNLLIRGTCYMSMNLLIYATCYIKTPKRSTFGCCLQVADYYNLPVRLLD